MMPLPGSEGANKNMFLELQALHECESPYLVGSYGAYLHVTIYIIYIGRKCERDSGIYG